MSLYYRFNGIHARSVSSPSNVVHHLRAGLARPWLVTKFKSLANPKEVYAGSISTLPGP